MEYIYTVMLLNKAGKEVNEENMAAVLKSAGVEADAAKIKSLVAALDGVDIEEVIAQGSTVVAAAPAAASTGGDAAPAAAEEKKEEEPAQSDEDAAAGLGSLF